VKRFDHSGWVWRCAGVTVVGGSRYQTCEGLMQMTHEVVRKYLSSSTGE
jgi:hypothetical protein